MALLDRAGPAVVWPKQCMKAGTGSFSNAHVDLRKPAECCSRGSLLAYPWLFWHDHLLHNKGRGAHSPERADVVTPGATTSGLNLPS